MKFQIAFILCAVLVASANAQFGSLLGEVGNILDANTKLLTSLVGNIARIPVLNTTQIPQELLNTVTETVPKRPNIAETLDGLNTAQTPETAGAAPIVVQPTTTINV